MKRPKNYNVKSRQLHHIQAVRRQQNIALRTAASRLGIGLQEASRQETETEDISVAQLFAWARVLNIPPAELLEMDDAGLSSPVLERSRLVRVMKTAAAISGQANDESVRRLAEILRDQLVEIMPELAHVAPWPLVGQRRAPGDLGRLADSPFSAEQFRDFA